MAKNKEIKTNAMRILDRMKISYAHYTYECEEFIDGMQIVEKLKLDPTKVYKTLVTQSASKEYFVFVIPVAEELDLKKAARVVNQKSLAMIHVKDINQITGYVRGGCTAVGMKKQYVTVIDETAEALDTMVVSGGRIGSQIELRPQDLAKASNAQFAPVTVEG
ncbi:MAG: Cys-tRNA(Pro) deacylase [Lachnospiraceae bacterium]|nr:Cys-tRNA(Pro) deacylase [Lachnospiraceae bacterium]